MSSVSLIALILVGTACGDKEVITEAIRSMLSLKGTVYPYSAEYELAFPPEPRIAGRTESRRIFAQSPSYHYSEQRDEFNRLRTLICDKEFLFGYFDTTNRIALFKGQVDRNGLSPERWLEDHAFVHNSTVSLDPDLVQIVQELLAGSRVAQHDLAGGVHTYHLSGSRLGDLIVVLGARTVEISAVGTGGAPTKSRRIFRYAYQDGRAPWTSAAVSDLKDDFKKGQGKNVHHFTGKFTMVSALEAFPRPELRVISLPDARKIASRHGYLLPQSSRATVIKAESYADQLVLDIKLNGKVYTIIQYPAASRLRDDESVALGVRGRRKLGDYTVLDICEGPFTEENSIYYLRDGVFLLVMDPQHKHILFVNHDLDRLIMSFSVVPPDDKGATKKE